MVATNDGPLQQAPDVLKRVRVNVAPNVFPLAVLDRFVLGVLIRDARVGFPFVGVDSLDIPRDVLTYEAVQGFPISSPDHLKAYVPATLKSTNHYGLVALVTASLAFDLAADEGLIGLNDALQELGVNFIKRNADSVTQIPRGLVGHVKSALELVRANTLLGLYNKVDGQKPLPKRKVGIVEDSASGNGKLIAA